MSSVTRSNPLFSVFTWLLAVSIACMAVTALWADDEPPADFDKLERQLGEAYTSKDYPKALKIAEKMHELRPEHVDTIYNIACLHCLLGHKDKAYKWIEKAIDAGYKDADHLAKDDDFKTIRGEDRFRSLVKRVRSATGEAVEKDEKPAKKAKPQKSAQPKKPAKPEKPAESETPDVPKMEPAKHAQKITELTQKLVEASGKGEKEKALKIALEALAHAKALQEHVGEKAAPYVSLTQYNVACMYSLMDKKDEAFKHLNKAIEAGSFSGDMVSQIENDSDFNNIRKDRRYAKALGKAGKLGAGDPSAEGDFVDFKWKVTVPKNYDPSKKAPLIIALHSHSGNMDKATKRWKKAAGKVGAVLLAPQGRYKLGDGQFHWGRNLDTIEENVMDAINAVLDEYKIDQDNVILTGFSEGGWATWALMMRNPDAFRGIIPVAGGFKVESESYFEDEDLSHLRIFIMVGANEKEPLLEGNKQAAKRFEKLGAKVKLNVYEGVGHEFPKKAYKQQLKALRFVLEG